MDVGAPDDPPEPDPGEWPLSTGDVSRIFGVRTQTVCRWADEGCLPSVRTPGGHRRFRRTDVESLERHIHHGGPHS